MEEILRPLYNTRLYNLLNLHDKRFNEIIEGYRKVCIDIIKFKKSKYSSVSGYTSYVYFIYDILFNKYYIGVRYGVSNRHNFSNSYEDLLIYKSSSTDDYFKNRLSNDLEGNFEYYIISQFDNEYMAMNYEALLHQLFEVSRNDMFYNKHTEIIREYKNYFNTLDEIYYDLINKEELTYNEIVCRKVKHKYLYKLATHHNLTIHKNRYCLKSRLSSLPWYIINYYNEVTLYLHNTSDNSYTKIKKLVWMWFKEIGASFTKIVSGQELSACNYYYNKYKMFKVIKKNIFITLFYLDIDTYEIKQITKSKTEWYGIMGWRIYKLIEGKINSIGYYFNSEEHLRKYIGERNNFIMYYYKNRKVYELGKPICDWRKECEYFIHILDGRQKSITLNGIRYYGTKRLCVESNLEYVVQNQHQKIRIRYWEGPSIIGKGWSTLAKGHVKSSLGWSIVGFNYIKPPHGSF